ncbi:MAG TPA: 2-oxoglutarate dehydrogenase complex dihydrolipoyllysine-residue succinyltransferase [Polyangiaceae bacterium]|jgi:2-oxoglutarate dehydrogenase E2 component (dihydrolipoamide succinyltransferase)|nr:2-oxoglutarate dehydrogenase complex dihydrolipoyllysine-residue succinyltransferase [Polyangiaceae bacterium]
MAVELRVPEVGESITEVEIGDWLKSEGERVSREEAVVMIDTDKVTVELPAPVTGVITKILVAKGGTAKVGEVIGYMDEAAAQSSRSTPPPAQVPAAAGPTLAPAPAAPPPAPVAARAPENTAPPRVMPAAERALHDTGLSAAQVSPSGPGGRMLKEDVERTAKGNGGAPAPARAPAPVPSPAPTSHDSEGDREEEIVAMTPMRRRIAERLVEAQQTAAMLTTFNEVDMSAVMALRKEFQPQFQERYGIKLGFMSFFVKASIDALRLVPNVNAEVRGTNIVYKNYYDVGVAVGGGKGLVVPIIRNAERLSFAEVEQAIADLGERAKKNAIKLEELQGGTFTISNGGIYGSMMSTPILNPPQSGILGLHAIQDRAVVRDGQIVIRPMMYLALTYDHRLVDGRDAVTCLKRIKETIEAPSRILLEV